ncbi:MAG: 16S rRNA (guanine(966)-N(2))-methyltransferase RsmD [Thermodesulfovibrionales bacterium]|nr:16S rRNA (guanine(966)-N(2))-methyltransferase RsmD [Thermodesulfovibrionales bacterium]
MRIVAGSLKGRKIPAKAAGASLKGGLLRPTCSKVRESIFNILGEKVKDSVFVDLYAGTGAVGIEAMSRRAKTVFFVESEGKRASGIEGMLSGCGCRPGAVIVRKKASAFIRDALREGFRADIIFLDPPYYSEELDNTLNLLSDGRLLKEGGLVMAEHHSKKILPEETGALMRRKSYKYGDTSLTLYKAGR